MTNQLTINAPAEVIKGENFLITVVQGINQTPVDAAAVFLDEESIGSTGAQGTMTYSANVTGEHTLKAEKEGFNSTTKKIKVVSSLKVIELTVPDKANVGSDMKISAIVQNAGSNDDSRLLELKANETVVGSKNATVKAGENSTVSFSYKPKDPGLTRISLDEQSKTVNVEKAAEQQLAHCPDPGAAHSHRGRVLSLLDRRAGQSAKAGQEDDARAMSRVALSIPIFCLLEKSKRFCNFPSFSFFHFRPACRQSLPICLAAWELLIYPDVFSHGTV